MGVKHIHLTVDEETHSKLKQRKGIISWEEYFFPPKLLSLEEVSAEVKKRLLADSTDLPLSKWINSVIQETMKILQCGGA